MAALLALVLAGACAPGAPGGVSAGLVRFRDCAQLAAHMRALTLPYVTAHGFGWSTRWDPNPVPGGGLGADGLVSRPTGGSGVLDTGRRGGPTSAVANHGLLVWMGPAGLQLADVSGRRPVPLGRLRLGDDRLIAGSILVRGHRVLVIGGAGFQAPTSRPYGTGLALVDIADPRRPRVLERMEITGRVVDAALWGGAAVVTIAAEPHLEFRGPHSRADEGAALAFNRAAVERTPVEAWLPGRRLVEAAGPFDATARPLVSCEDVYRPAADSGLQVLTAVHVDLGRRDGLSTAASVALVAETDTVTVGEGRLHVATFAGAWGRALARDAPGGPPVRRTAVHVFSLTGRAPGHIASGEVGGWIPGGWGMSARGAELRVFAADSRYFPNDLPSAVTVLRVEPGHLRRVARIERRDLDIYRVGWLGDVMVTSTVGDQVRLMDVTAPAPAAPAPLDRPVTADYVTDAGPGSVLTISNGRDGRRRLEVGSYDVTTPASPRHIDTLTFDAPSGSTFGAAYLPSARTLVIPGFARVRDRHTPTLYAVRLGPDGALSPGGRWRSAGPVSAAALEDGRVVALDSGGSRLTILDADGLRVLGSARA